MKKITSKNFATLSLVSILALSSLESFASPADTTEKTHNVTIRTETKKLGQNLGTYGKEKSKDTVAAIEHALREARDKIEQLGDELKEKSKDAYDKLYDKYKSAKEKSADKAHEAHEHTLAHLEKMSKDLDDKIAKAQAKRKET